MTKLGIKESGRIAVHLDNGAGQGARDFVIFKGCALTFERPEAIPERRVEFFRGNRTAYAAKGVDDAACYQVSEVGGAAGGELIPCTGLGVEGPGLGEAASAGAAEEDELHTTSVERDAVVLTGCGLNAAGDFCPAIGAEVEGPLVVEAARIGEAVKDDHAVALIIEDSGVAVAIGGASAVDA